MKIIKLERARTPALELMGLTIPSVSSTYLKIGYSDNFSGAGYKPHSKIWHTVFRAMFSMFLCGSTQNLSEYQNYWQNVAKFVFVVNYLRYTGLLKPPKFRKLKHNSKPLHLPLSWQKLTAKSTENHFYKLPLHCCLLVGNVPRIARWPATNCRVANRNNNTPDNRNNNNGCSSNEVRSVLQSNRARQPSSFLEINKSGKYCLNTCLE